MTPGEKLLRAAHATSNKRFLLDEALAAINAASKAPTIGEPGAGRRLLSDAHSRTAKTS